MRRVKKIVGFSLFGAYIVVMMSFVNVDYHKVACTAIDIVIRDSTSTRFVQARDITHILQKEKFELLTKRPSEINLNTIEECVRQHPSIKECECYFLSNNTLRIAITQRHPIARIMTPKHNFYIDDIGAEMPPSLFYTAHVPIITGHIKESIVSTDLFKIAQHIHQDPFWEAQIEQINVDRNGEYSLIPRAGRQVIELGNAENLDVKFQSLKALYLQIFNNNSWNKYKTISLKYDGQVVCTKK